MLLFFCQSDSFRANVIKLFTPVIYNCSQKAMAFVGGKSIQPSLMFVGETGAYPIEEPFWCSTQG
jgi:hypothetical protein